MTELELTGPYKIGDQILGDLEVTGFLGMGGHAYVYECVDKYMDATIAVKVIPNVPGRGKGLLNRARAEAKLLFKLNHPNVVRVMTARPVGDKMVCIVMEKLDGLSLRQFLRLHKRFTVTEALLIVRQIAAGVGAAHRLNVIHRDIKPENVFILPPDNQVKVLDFGIAKFLGQGLETTNKFRVHGTPLYMSPEHLQNSNITNRSDIYELGGVAFELMTGKIPCLVDLDNPNFQQMAYVQIMKATPPVSRLIRDVGPRTEQLIKRATAKDPSQRFASMQDVIDAIDEALIEQKTLFPREAQTIRYVNEDVICAAKLAETATDDEEDDWEPVHDIPSSTPHQVDTHIPTLGMRQSGPISADSGPQVPVKQKASVMAPTVELSQGRLPRPSQPAVAAESAPVPTPLVILQSQPTTRTSSVSSANLCATNDLVPQEIGPRSSWFHLPLPIVAATILTGFAIAFAVSWPEIQKAKARHHVVTQVPTASTASILQAPVTLAEPSAVHVPSPPSLPTAPTQIIANPNSAAPPAMAVNTAAKPKAAPAKSASKAANQLLIGDDEPPAVTKVELDRMRAREKALAADLDREAAAARKAKALKP